MAAAPPAQTLQLDPRQDDAVGALTTAFAGLAPGDALMLETPGDPRKLARGLCDAAWGQFDWVPLRQGAPVTEGGDWQVEVRKRTDPGPQGLSGFLTEDHKRCDDLFAEAEQAALAGNVRRAASLFVLYRTGMLRHLRMEEDVLFPALDARMGFHGQGPTAVMREEHTQIRSMLTQMGESLAAEDAGGFADACETVLILMEQHNMKEEEVLYPMMDGVLGADADDLLQQLLTC